MNSLDERVFCLLNPSDNKTVEAIGVRFMGSSDYLVGVYLSWPNSREDPKEFLKKIVDIFGEARLYQPPKFSRLGLVSKMSIDVPNLRFLYGDGGDYEKMKIDLLEIRASNPKPFLALSYDTRRKVWACKPFPVLSCIDSNYGIIPN